LKLQTGEPVELSPDRSYPSAQKYLQEHHTHNEQFWHDYLSLIETHEDLSGLLKPEYKQTVLSDYQHIKESKDIGISITGKRYEQIKSLCLTNGFTVSALLQYCWHKQLSIYGNANTTVVGMTVSGRNLPINGIEQSVGLYINTLPVILEHESCPVIIQIKKLQNYINEINSRSNINLAKLQKRERRLFDTLFVFENYPVPKNQNDLDKDFSFEFIDSKEKVDYPISIVGYENNSTIELRLLYAGELFEEKTMHQILDGIDNLLNQLIKNSRITTNEIQHINKNLLDQIVYEWNRTQQPYPSDRTIHALFEEQVEKTPDDIAVVYENTRLTYKELNERSNQLAAYLIDIYDIQPDDLIALCLNRSEHMLIAILAVLKSGGAYVPIDPNTPDDRIAYILSDIKTSIVLCNVRNKVKLQNNNKEINTVIESIDDATFEFYIRKSYSPINIKSKTNSGNLAYVIYTSGTTGIPKGVMIEHKNVINLTFAQKIDLFITNDNINVKKKCLWYSNYIFDAHVWELYVTILNGHSLFIIDDKDRMDLRYLNNYIISK
jgi:non-ribosomal peptide synthetase component F